MVAKPTPYSWRPSTNIAVPKVFGFCTSHFLEERFATRWTGKQSRHGAFFLSSFGGFSYEKHQREPSLELCTYFRSTARASLFYAYESYGNSRRSQQEKEERRISRRLPTASIRFCKHCRDWMPIISNWRSWELWHKFFQKVSDVKLASYRILKHIFKTLQFVGTLAEESVIWQILFEAFRFGFVQFYVSSGEYDLAVDFRNTYSLVPL